ncbi:hypothetical protein HK405_011975 [Cladochytrium tenue]|nr:hypothetical protein HK405_011975 [Cladochytrium tenue]
MGTPSATDGLAHLSVAPPANINPGHGAWDAVDAYLETTLLLPSHAPANATPLPAAAAAVQHPSLPFADFLERQSAAGINAINVSPTQAAWLSATVASLRATSVLEIGTLGGYSAAWLVRGLQSAAAIAAATVTSVAEPAPRNPRLVTLELSETVAAVARTNLASAGLLKTDAASSGIVEVKVGRAVDSLKELELAGEVFDFVFIDADKESYPEYLEAVLKLTKVGSVIVADNVVRRGEIVNPDSADPRVLGVRRYLELLGKESRLMTSALQTVGSKGYDGLTLSVVVAP